MAVLAYIIDIRSFSLDNDGDLILWRRQLPILQKSDMQT